MRSPNFFLQICNYFGRFEGRNDAIAKFSLHFQIDIFVEISSFQLIAMREFHSQSCLLLLQPSSTTYLQSFTHFSFPTFTLQGPRGRDLHLESSQSSLLVKGLRPNIVKGWDYWEKKKDIQTPQNWNSHESVISVMPAGIWSRQVSTTFDFYL